MDVGVYGLGRFGSFWSDLLAPHYSVKGYNRSSRRETPGSVVRVSLDELGGCPVIFLCVSISAVPDVLTELRPHLREDALVMDTCSVKVFPVTEMQRLLPEPIQIIGTHPMFGPDSARDGVDGLPLIYTPVRAADETVSEWRRFFASIGLDVVEMAATEHDREAAYTQGITHFLGRLLKELDVRPSRISTLGYRKILEVVEQTCNDPYQLFVDLQRYNPYSADMRDRLRASFDRLLGRISSELDSQSGRR